MGIDVEGAVKDQIARDIQGAEWLALYEHLHKEIETLRESRALVYAENERLRKRLDEATEIMRKLGK